MTGPTPEQRRALAQLSSDLRRTSAALERLPGWSDLVAGMTPEQKRATMFRDARALIEAQARGTRRRAIANGKKGGRRSKWSRQQKARVKAEARRLLSEGQLKTAVCWEIAGKVVRPRVPPLTVRNWLREPEMAAPKKPRKSVP